MPRYEDVLLDKNIIIDLVVKPHVDVVKIIQKIVIDEDLIVIDTMGGFLLKNINNVDIIDDEEIFYCDDNVDISHHIEDDQSSISSLTSTSIYLCQSITKLFKIFKYIIKKKIKNFVLVIDSICFVADREPFVINNVMINLWNIVYKCNCTIILINHYRLEYKQNKLKCIPRMGNKYFKMVTKRIEIK